MTKAKPLLVVGLDPGTTHTALVLWDGESARYFYEDNNSILDRLDKMPVDLEIACEMIASYGMAVGATTFETCLWIGRYIQTRHFGEAAGRFHLVYRKDIKMHLCGSMRAKDANVRQALIDRFGGVGTKKNPGKLYGIASHGWSALAVAVYHRDQLEANA